MTAAFNKCERPDEHEGRESDSTTCVETDYAISTPLSSKTTRTGSPCIQDDRGSVAEFIGHGCYDYAVARADFELSAEVARLGIREGKAQD